MKIGATITAIAAGALAVAAFTGLVGGQEIPSAALPEVTAPLGHQHNHEGLSWPPQPRDIVNVVIHSSAEQEKLGHDLQRARLDRLRQKAATDPKASRALGTAFTPVTVIDKEGDKADGGVITQLVVFSRDNNATVEIEFDGNEAIQAVKSVPASKYQPEIADEEAAEAAQLARVYFLSQGVAKVAVLKAYGILAYRPEEVGFFDTRVIYVSFHAHDDAPPELAAWVDLTHQRILKTRQEQ